MAGGDSLAFDSNAYKRAYEKEKYAIYKVRIPKEKKAVIDDLVISTGKSANRIFVESVEKMYHIDLTIIDPDLEQFK